ncbi:YhcH/YjgK/YiaL family protein [Neobacillus cucumis]|uniref:YhcH/YjgK/YiaL family protein n=1 Tax=Neobacillus cucumis TaxID=1740721 RepID=UPI0028534A6B|nr:YhcH/YjgK/YiaL family protein [Neobacillus cucumis]MDR4949581.1 YhcH/YjgK/YiaL family protein [Neobacillus cucumis]
MIIDLIENLDEYRSLNPKFSNGLVKLNEVEIDYNKRFDFDGGYLFFQEGTTNPIDEGTFEAHKKYIDIQIVLDGSEYVAWTPINQLVVEVEYNAEKDVVRLNGSPKEIMKINKGMAYICLPHDGHKALKHINQATKYKKAVIKIEI